VRREQIPAILIAVGLVLLAVWIARHTYWKEVRQRVQSPDEVSDPFYAAEKLAARLGAYPEWRHDIGQLPPPDGVIVAGPWSWSRFPHQITSLERWVESGGRLVLDRRLIGGTRELDSWAGVWRVPLDGPDGRPQLDAEPGEASLESGEPALRRTAKRTCCFDRTTELRARGRPTWTLRGSHVEGMRVAVGHGSVTVLNGWPFTENALLSDSPEFDANALVFSDALQLRRGDTIYFISDASGPTLLALMWSTGWPVIVLAACLLALILWRSAPRFGPLEAPAESSRRSLAEQIRGTGQFTLRYGGGQALHQAALRALHEAAARRILGYTRLGLEERVAALAKLSGLAPEPLARALADTTPQGRRGLYNTLLAIESARRGLLGTAAALGAAASKGLKSHAH
jgi:hypothetical protein